MAKKPKELLDLDQPGIGEIESTLSLDSIMLKRLKWTAKLYINQLLPKSYRQYNIRIELDEAPYLERIEELEKGFESTLFAHDKGMRKENNQKVKELRDKLAGLRKECEEIKFIALVEELKYKDNQTLLVVRIPDDIIEPFNRQKTRLDIYKITLIPIL